MILKILILTGKRFLIYDMGVFRKRFPTERRRKLGIHKDVARQAGVAISTVSKVLNGYEGVSESTKDKVNAAIEALNYTPNALQQHFPPNSLGGCPVVKAGGNSWLRG